MVASNAVVKAALKGSWSSARIDHGLQTMVSAANRNEVVSVIWLVVLFIGSFFRLISAERVDARLIKRRLTTKGANDNQNTSPLLNGRNSSP